MDYVLYGLLIPSTINLVQWVYGVFRDWDRAGRYSLEVPEYNMGNRNYFYCYITFLMEIHHLLDQEKNLIIKSSTYNPNHAISVGEKKWNFERPVVSPELGFTTVFRYEDFEVTIVANKNVYMILAEKRCYLDAFISYTNGLQERYVQTIWKVNEVNLTYIS